MGSTPAELLVGTVPEWFSITSSTATTVCGSTSDSRWKSWPSGLRLTIAATIEPCVAETTPGTDLPARCAERHIQSDHTFCLGLSPPKVLDEGSAVDWWATLWAYLECQSVAAETQVWPLHNALDHGPEAGRCHRLALSIADQLGIPDDYARTHQGEATWLNGRGLLRLGWGKRQSVDNSPRHRPRFAFRRRNKVKVLWLMLVERRRADQLTKYWQAARRGGAKCCGTMRSCPLKT